MGGGEYNPQHNPQPTTQPALPASASANPLLFLLFPPLCPPALLPSCPPLPRVFLATHDRRPFLFWSFLPLARHSAYPRRRLVVLECQHRRLNFEPHLSHSKTSLVHVQPPAARPPSSSSHTRLCPFLGSPRWLLSLALRCVVLFYPYSALRWLSPLAFGSILPSLAQLSRPLDPKLIRHRGVICATFHASLSRTVVPTDNLTAISLSSAPQAFGRSSERRK
jgi:hypothetical protein